MEERKYDVIIWGATGFTGELVAEHYAKNAPDTLRWAIGGRSKQKIESVRQKLSLNVDCVLGDNNDQSSVDNIVRQTRVLLSCVGPFYVYGTPFVDACVRLGTHYCDITGEFWWIKQIILKYHTKAKENGVLIVPACGYDSIPSDLGAFHNVNIIKRKLNETCGYMREIISVKGDISGGTIQTSLLGASLPEARKDMKDVYSLNPPEKKGSGLDRRPPVRYDKDVKAYTGPFMMEVINARVVRRSAAILDYGPKFHFDEVMKGFWLILILIEWMLPIALFFMSFSFISRFVSRVLPSGGYGPSREKMKKNWFNHTFISETTETKQRVITKVKGSFDPGYFGTAMMVGQAALCLAQQRDSLPEGGVLTPATAFGEVLIEQLKKHGLEFVVEESK